MARIVVKSSFVSPGSPGGTAHLLNYVGYIATREGVELTEAPSADPFQEISTRSDHPPTQKQARLIRQLLEDFPDSRESLEYEDYQASPSMGTASEFISRCMEDNFFVISSREGYIQYLATRPGAEREGAHGLWGASDEPLDLEETGYRVAHHDGNVWTHIISLRREDAIKTGMESAESWRELVRSQAGTVAHAMGIPLADLRWYAAFHNEGHHPHIHMVAYSAGAEPYLGKKGLQEIKSGMAKEIFREELLEIYQAQTQSRDMLTASWRDMLSGGEELSRAEAQLAELARYLSHHKGKAVCGYLPKQQRELVSRIVDTLGQHPRIRSLYDDWYAQRDKITGIYKGTPEERLPLSQNKAFKTLKNAVIQTAAQLAAGTAEVLPGEAHWRVPPLPEEPEPEPLLTTPEEWLEHYPYPGEPERTKAADLPAQTGDGERVYEKKKGWWTENYQYARSLLYGNLDQDPNPQAAFAEMQAEADTGNPLAQHDLGRMLLKGIAAEADPEAAAAYFRKALAGFAREAGGDRPAYWQYRVGKMHAMGYGTEQDCTQSAAWYRKAVELKNPFAAYALAGQYHRGQGVEQSDTEAFRLYTMAATDEKSPSPYAMWELAKMCEQGVGTPVDPEAAGQWYARACAGFAALESRQPDDRVAFRLGWMEFHGIGTEQDIPAAIRHFERASELGNPQAVYTLSKLLIQDEHIPRDIPRAAALLEGLKKDEFYAPMAACRLGRLYTTEQEVWDMAKGVENLKFAAGQGDHFAAYALGRLYLFGQGEYHNRELGMEYLRSAAEQGNEYAAQTLQQLQETEVRQAACAALGLLRLFARAMKPRQQQQQKQVSDRQLHRRELEKKQAQGMKIG